jgi:tetratricopeptide (TPR) repeat protein
MPNRQDRSGAHARVPRLCRGVDPQGLKLSPAEFYLLSRVDGRTPWAVLRDMGGLSPEEADRCLERWLEQRITEIAPTVPRQARTAAAKKTSGPLDPSLEISIEVQRRILDFEKRVELPYHQILGVAQDASAADIKRAYFELSKEFHPDRYFRRNTGPYADRLERIFRRLHEACEMLTDPKFQAQIREQAAAAGAASAQTAADKPGRTRRVLPKRPGKAAAKGAAKGAGASAVKAKGKGPGPAEDPLVRERQRKAQEFFEAAVEAQTGGRFADAVSIIQLDISFDPANQAYRDRYTEFKRKSNETRAEHLGEKAESSVREGEVAQALELIEEALELNPQNPELLHRAARLHLEAGHDLQKAKDFARRACERKPDAAPQRRTMARVYAACGLRDLARAELEKALQIDPKDTETQEELRALGRRWPSFSLGGRR